MAAKIVKLAQPADHIIDQVFAESLAEVIIVEETARKLEAAANPNVRLVEYAIRLELSPKG